MTFSILFWVFPATKAKFHSILKKIPTLSSTIPVAVSGVSGLEGGLEGIL